MQFYLNVNNRTHIGLTEFDKIRQLPVNVRLEQCSSSMAFKFFVKTSFPHMNMFKTNHGENNFSYLAPTM